VRIGRKHIHGMKNLNARSKKLVRISLFSILCLIMIGCSKKTISGKYYIELFAEGDPVYYVGEKGVDSGGGVFDGIVKQVGWRGDEIVAEVVRLSSGDVSGWYKLDIKNGSVTGPITNSELSKFHLVDADVFFNDPKKHKK
jgi:hypothetical protein